jgi:hypothetical protein
MEPVISLVLNAQKPVHVVLSSLANLKRDVSLALGGSPAPDEVVLLRADGLELGERDVATLRDGETIFLGTATGATPRLDRGDNEMAQCLGSLSMVDQPVDLGDVSWNLLEQLQGIFTLC